MSVFQKRLYDLEERKAFREFTERDRELKGRTGPELTFFAVHGYLPESAGDILPHRLEFTVRGIKTIVITERADEDDLTPLVSEQKANRAL